MREKESYYILSIILYNNNNNRILQKTIQICKKHISFKWFECSINQVLLCPLQETPGPPVGNIITPGIVP